MRQPPVLSRPSTANPTTLRLSRHQRLLRYLGLEYQPSAAVHRRSKERPNDTPLRQTA